MEKYTESMYYQIKLTEKLCKIFCKQLEDTLNLPITMDEFTMLNIIKEHNGDIHQRDIAKMLFKDRANTGKMLNKLEEKGYIEKFEKGLDIGGYVTAPAKIRIISEDLVKNSYISTVEITIHEGKNRQIRRMCSSLNHEVISLKRVSIGDLKLG